MKYDTETTNLIKSKYLEGATTLSLATALDVPERSIIAKLASMGVYRKKEYLDKQGNPPMKKEVYIERIAKLLDTNAEMLESLEKVNKSVLKMLEEALSL